MSGISPKSLICDGGSRPRIRSGAETLIEQYLSFAKYQGYYDQIRLIGLDGREVVRINWNSGAPSDCSRRKVAGQIQPVLRPGGDEASLPARSCLPFRSQRRRRRHRAADQADDPSGRWRLRREWPQAGTDCPQLSGRIALKRYSQAGCQTAGDIWLLNNSGQWLIGPRPQDEWAFMFPGLENRSFARMHPNAWKRIERKGGSGQFVSGGELFVRRRSPLRRH